MQNARSISELNRLIQQALETELDPVIWVIGEIADFRQAPQGDLNPSLDPVLKTA